MYLNKDETVDAIVKAAFPDYNGKTIKAFPAEQIVFHGTNWSEGCCREYVVLNIQDLTPRHVPIEMYFGDEAYHRPVAIPPNFVVVVRVYSGLRQHIEIHAHPNTITPMLDKPVQLTGDETIVLIATRTYKSSYAGIKDYRFHEAKCATGITLDRWESASRSLINRKLLNKAGALTVEGRNAVGRKDFSCLTTSS